VSNSNNNSAYDEIEQDIKAQEKIEVKIFEILERYGVKRTIELNTLMNQLTDAIAKTERDTIVHRIVNGQCS